jgi:hypothetical protein
LINSPIRDFEPAHRIRNAPSIFLEIAVSGVDVGAVGLVPLPVCESLCSSSSVSVPILLLRVSQNVELAGAAEILRTRKVLKFALHRHARRRRLEVFCGFAVWFLDGLDQTCAFADGFFP